MENSYRDSPLDYERFSAQMCGNNEHLAIKLVKLLIEERAPDFMDKITTAVAARDEEEIRSLCHTIHGTVSNMCADKIGELASGLGNLAKGSKVEKYDQALSQLITEFDNLLDWGNNFIASL